MDFLDLSVDLTARDYTFNEPRPCIFATSPRLWRITRRCSNCGSITPMCRRCKGCSGTWYCTTKCAAAHWKYAGHRTACQTLSARRDLIRSPIQTELLRPSDGAELARLKASEQSVLKFQRRYGDLLQQTAGRYTLALRRQFPETDPCAVPALVFVVQGIPSHLPEFEKAQLTIHCYEPEWTLPLSCLREIMEVESNIEQQDGFAGDFGSTIAFVYGVRLMEVTRFWAAVYRQGNDWQPQHTGTALASLQMNLLSATTPSLPIDEICQDLQALVDDNSHRRPHQLFELRGVLDHLPLAVALNLVRINMLPDRMQGIDAGTRLQALSLLRTDVPWELIHLN